MGILINFHLAVNAAILFSFAAEVPSKEDLQLARGKPLRRGIFHKCVADLIILYRHIYVIMWLILQRDMYDIFAIKINIFLIQFCS